MVWGIFIAIMHGQGLFPAHAPLKPVGWVNMGLFRLYEALTPAAALSLVTLASMAVFVWAVLRHGLGRPA
jgi:hypothetical protein